MNMAVVCGGADFMKGTKKVIRNELVARVWKKKVVVLLFNETRKGSGCEGSYVGEEDVKRCYNIGF